MPDNDPKHHRLTVGQLQQTHQKISQLVEEAKEVTQLLLAAYGPEDSRAVRAQEIRDAIQRLEWAMERAETKTE